MEPEGSLPHSQVPVTCPYPNPAWYSPYPYIPLPEDPSWYHPLIYTLIFHVVSFLQVSPLLDDLKDRREYSQLKEEALDRTMWRNRFRGGFGPVVKQNTERMNLIKGIIFEK